MDANTSTLNIVNVNGSHAGEYFCTAQFSENGIMMIFNSTKANLTVNCKYIIMQNHSKVKTRFFILLFAYSYRYDGWVCFRCYFGA